MHDQAFQAKLAQCGTSALSPYAPTLKERLENQKAQAEAQLANVNAALAALEEFPGVEKCITALSKVGGIY